VAAAVAERAVARLLLPVLLLGGALVLRPVR